MNCVSTLVSNALTLSKTRASPLEIVSNKIALFSWTTVAIKDFNSSLALLISNLLPSTKPVTNVSPYLFDSNILLTVATEAFNTSTSIFSNLDILPISAKIKFLIYAPWNVTMCSIACSKFCVVDIRILYYLFCIIVNQQLLTRSWINSWSH